MTERPEIASINSSSELRQWYWRKDELVPHARTIGLKASSGKFEILERIGNYLDSGERHLPSDTAAGPKSRFDWHSAQLSKTTEITDSYKNSQNVSRFFQAELGAGFKFKLALMDWMRANVGKTLADACEAYLAIKNSEKLPGFKTKIKSHNQFNQFTRDILDDDSTLSMTDVRKIWSLKIKLPSPDRKQVYQKSNLDLEEDSSFRAQGKNSTSLVILKQSDEPTTAENKLEGPNPSGPSTTPRVSSTTRVLN